MATLKDIARKLDLSITQVSRALNDHSDVNEDTRAKVKRAARAMNYHPNLSARKLVSGRSGMVGLVVHKSETMMTDGIFLEVIAGLSAQFSGRGMQFVLHIMEADEPPLPVYQRLIGNGALDGFVLIDPQDNDPIVRFLQRADWPFVVHGRTEDAPAYPYFDIENKDIFYQLTKHFLAAGHRNIAAINGVRGRTYVTARSRGFRQALVEAGLDPAAARETFGPMTEALGLISTMGFFSASGPRPAPPPTAIICGNVRIAKGVYQALEALGLSVPGDVSVVAHDDHLPNLRASAFFPSLTVTKAPLRDSWKPLADYLAGAIEGRPLAQLQEVGKHEFIERNSVSSPSS
jgi:LacI family transcriptional regulator